MSPFVTGVARLEHCETTLTMVMAQAPFGCSRFLMGRKAQLVKSENVETLFNSNFLPSAIL